MLNPLKPKAHPMLSAVSALCLLANPGLAETDAFHAVSGNELSWKETRVIMAQHCFECHGGFLTEGGIDLLAQRDESSIEANPEQWEKVIDALRNHYMPPLEGRALPDSRRKALISNIDQRLITLAGDDIPPSAGLRRLNRTEFGNTLRDLLFVDINFHSSLPPDDSGYGFDNIADVLTVSPLLLEKYLDAAAIAGEQAIPMAKPSRILRYAGMEFDGANGRSENGVRYVYASGLGNAGKLKMNLSTPGIYKGKIALAAQQAGGENARAKAFWNRKEVAQFEVLSESTGSPDIFEFTVTAEKPGPAEIHVEFVNDHYNPDAPEGEAKDRNLIVAGLDWTGPEQSEQFLMTEFLRYHFGGDPKDLAPGKIREGIWRFASRAYRRKATKDEINSLWKVYQDTAGSDNSSARLGLRAVVDATLASPNFLFRRDSVANPDDFMLASWLSYFLWSTLPDDRLFELARKKQLSEQLEEEVRRMLKDPKAAALADNFAAQWWQFRDLANIKPNRTTYPKYNAALRHSMQKETKLFFEDIVEHDRSILRILDADYTFADKRLSEFYGLKERPKGGFKRVSIAETERRGIWSQASILTVTSHANTTSPVLRGKWILENLVGLTPPPPPANVPSLPGSEKDPTPTDLRSRLAQHRDNPNCASCHAIMDPFGLALETYDGIGGWRPEEQRAEVQTETLFDGTSIENPMQLAAYLSEYRRDDFVATFAEKLVTYANGRGITWRDGPALADIAEETAQNGYRFSSLVLAVIERYAPGVVQPNAIGDTAWVEPAKPKSDKS
ncbi:DUF1592 domain-containing protein [Rubellicoccus peritrichatus]|uniref:DUF1592 domain-containing protein n=1 Tax=Rubellicoccus peritrichatus TaxID=3080537 RepID=A0AAQ3L9H7_9BACT|nr:DUF1592 domain-containing protein [Puniceicoccus sp. CR14]WOO41855.1 DUF1592 domain-containing protein [Puniceicoccus sp. CR14]